MRERPILFSAPMVRAILSGAKTQTRRLVKPQQPREANPGDFPYEFELTERNGDVTLYTTEQLVERCPYGAVGDQLWVRESFWCKNETCDHEYCGGCDLGSLLSLGEPYACVQYVATPESSSPPECTGGETIAPHTGEPAHGYWWLSPPSGWDGESDYSGSGEWMFCPTAFATKHPSIHMPRWASRITLEVTGVRVERLHAITEDDAKAEGVEAVDGMYDAADLCRAAKRAGRSAEDARGWFAWLWSEINGAESWDANPFVWVVEFRRGGVEP